MENDQIRCNANRLIKYREFTTAMVGSVTEIISANDVYVGEPLNGHNIKDVIPNCSRCVFNQSRPCDLNDDNLTNLGEQTSYENSMVNNIPETLRYRLPGLIVGIHELLDKPLLTGSIAAPEVNWYIVKKIEEMFKVRPQLRQMLEQSKTAIYIAVGTVYPRNRHGFSKDNSHDSVWRDAVERRERLAKVFKVEDER